MKWVNAEIIVYLTMYWTVQVQMLIPKQWFNGL